MSTPMTTTSPPQPTGSSNPVSLKFWWEVICNWIKLLSPDGASAYDTGWVAVTAIAPWTSQLEVRRIGRTVMCRGQFQAPTGGGSTTGNAWYPLGTIPSGFRPTGFLQLPLNWAGLGFVQGRITSAGVIELRTPAGSTSFTQFAAPSISGNVWSVD